MIELIKKPVVKKYKAVEFDGTMKSVVDISQSFNLLKISLIMPINENGTVKLEIQTSEVVNDDKQVNLVVNNGEYVIGTKIGEYSNYDIAKIRAAQLTDLFEEA